MVVSKLNVFSNTSTRSRMVISGKSVSGFAGWCSVASKWRTLTPETGAIVSKIFSSSGICTEFSFSGCGAVCGAATSGIPLATGLMAPSWLLKRNVSFPGASCTAAGVSCAVCGCGARICIFKESSSGACGLETGADGSCGAVWMGGTAACAAGSSGFLSSAGGTDTCAAGAFSGVAAPAARVVMWPCASKSIKQVSSFIFCSKMLKVSSKLSLPSAKSPSLASRPALAC